MTADMAVENVTSNNEEDFAFAALVHCMTYMPVTATTFYTFNKLVEALPVNTLSSSQELVAGVTAAVFTNTAFGKVIDTVKDTGKTYMAAGLVVSGIAAGIALNGHFSQKAEQFRDMKQSVASECFREQLPKGTEVVRHRHADGFYTYTCPRYNPTLGFRNMPDGPVRN